MASEKDIENLIKMLDGKVQSGTSRINVVASDNVADGEVKEIHHHGRCDVGSAWAKGTVKILNALTYQLKRKMTDK